VAVDSGDDSNAAFLTIFVNEHIALSIYMLNFSSTDRLIYKFLECVWIRSSKWGPGVIIVGYFFAEIAL